MTDPQRKQLAFLTPDDIAVRWNASNSAIYRGLQRGTIPGRKLANRWKTRLDVLEQFELRHTSQPGLEREPAASTDRKHARFAIKVDQLARGDE